MTRRFVIEDSIHLDQHGTFPSLDAALEKLRHFARAPWDERPNRAPCLHWEGCGRDYEILDYDDSDSPSKLNARIPAVAISRDAVTWHSPFRAHRPFAKRSRPKTGRGKHPPDPPSDVARR